MPIFPNIKVELRSGFFIILAVSILLIPIHWVIGWFIAAATHEIGHILSIMLLDVRIYSVQLDICGAKIESENMHPAAELIGSLAGPVAALILVLFYRCFPYVAICAVVQSLFNLLPIYPMDGGRVLYCACSLIANERIANYISKVVSIVTILLICVAITYIGWKYFGIFSLMPCIILSLKRLPRKYPCKVKKQIVK